MPKKWKRDLRRMAREEREEYLRAMQHMDADSGASEGSSKPVSAAGAVSPGSSVAKSPTDDAMMNPLVRSRPTPTATAAPAAAARSAARSAAQTAQSGGRTAAVPTATAVRAAAAVPTTTGATGATGAAAATATAATAATAAAAAAAPPTIVSTSPVTNPAQPSAAAQFAPAAQRAAGAAQVVPHSPAAPMAASPPVASGSAAGSPAAAAAAPGEPASSPPASVPTAVTVNSLGKRVERIKWRSTEVVILPGKTFTFPVLVTHKGSMLGWRFETKEHDIAFSLHLQQEDGTCTQIVPTTRYDAHLETVYATGRVEKTGTCVFTWDNSYSWWNAKQLVYSIELTFEAPEVDDAQAAFAALESAKNSLRTHITEQEVLERRQHELRDDMAAAEAAVQAARDRLAAAREQLSSAEARAAAVQGSVEALHQRIRSLLFASLPRKARLRILSFSDPVDIVAWERVSKSWQQMCRDEQLWELICQARGVAVPVEPPASAAGSAEHERAARKRGEGRVSAGKWRTAYEMWFKENCSYV